MIPLLLLVTATFRPPAPTVGDLITIDFQQPVVLNASSDYEIVSQRGSRVVVRTFEPRPFVISGRAGAVLFRNMVLPVRSVLKPRDSMTPAPLKPPRAEPYPRMPFLLMAIAALLAIGTWIAVFVMARRAARPQVVEPVLPPAERFRATVVALRDDAAAPRRWAGLADAVREYLAATTNLGMELTTRELLASISVGQAILPILAFTAQAGSPAPHHTVAEILRQGDLEKFSPWGARPGDFAALANRALELAPEQIEEQAA